MVRWPEWNNAMVTSEAKQRMLTNVWRESYMRIFKTLEQAQTDRDLYQRQAADLAIALEEYLRVFDDQSVDNDDMPYLLEDWTLKARAALEEYKLAQ